MKKEYYYLWIVLILSTGIYFWGNSIIKYERQEVCTELGIKLGEINRNQLKNLGQDKTYGYIDEYVYNHKLRTCLYYKEKIPVSFSEKAIPISSKEIINASTNKKILSLIKVITSPEEFSDKSKSPTCKSYNEIFKCETKQEFLKIKEVLFSN